MKQAQQRVKAGKYRSFLETRYYAQGVKVALPVLTVKGSKSGKMAVIMACQHGRELNGIAAIERVFRQLNPRKLKGTVVFLPVMNPIGARIHAQDYPLEQTRYRKINIVTKMNMNRVWFDARQSSNHTYSREVTKVVWDAYLKHADVCLDLHGWSGLTLSLAMADKKHRALLHAFGCPWCHVIMDGCNRDSGMNHDLMAAHGIATIVCELVPQNIINNESVRIGERGILNIMKFTGMLDGDLDLPEYQYEFMGLRGEMSVKTPAEGLVVTDFSKGQMVRKGQTVVRVLSLETLATAWEFRAPHDALIFQVGGSSSGEDIPESSMVYPGQTVAVLKKSIRIIHNR